jgi:hypothetical protein
MRFFMLSTITFLLFAVTQISYAQGPLFSDPVNYNAGSHPTSVFAIDLDGDGDNDLAAANFTSANVSVLLNNGDGTFQAAVNYEAGHLPVSVFAADLDEDGDNDLAVANDSSGTVSVFLNNANGTFQTPVNYVVGVGPESVFAVDLDGDGDNDFATANAGGYSGYGNVSILLNNGDGTFQTAVDYGAGDGPCSVFAVDLDGDSNNDITESGIGLNQFSRLTLMVITIMTWRWLI